MSDAADSPASATPLSRPLASLLRRAVLDHAQSERRRHFPASLHVGSPNGTRLTIELGPEHADLGHGTRTDLVAALLRAGGPDPVPLVWLTRSGELSLQDVDADWLPAAASAARESGLAPVLAVVTRRGWWRPDTGERREWKRLRQR